MSKLNTLENISKYSNKLIRLATYFSYNNDKLMFQQLSIINENSPIEDILESFAKDIDNTAKHIIDVQKMLGSINDEHILEELDNNEKDMSVLFGGKYNKEDKSLKIFNIEISNHSNFDKNIIKNKLSQSIIDIDFDEFKNLSKIRLSDKKWEIYELESLEEKIDYLSRTETISSLQDITKKIINSSIEFQVERRNMNIEERAIVDRNITGTRAMVDSIIQNSTHIVKDNIDQTATKHKKEKDKLDKISNLLIDSNIHNIELDPDTDLNKVINVIEKVNELDLNIHNSFTFKVRKLGNYKANGLYFPFNNIVAVDLAKPSALIHEITHLIDINNKEIFNSNARQDMIVSARQHLDIRDLESRYSMRYASYINNPQEIIARLGEISYLLNKYDYKDGSVKDFMDKVEILQVSEKQTPNDICISKIVSDYRSMSDIYFGFDNWDSEFAKDVKTYYQSYFTPNGLDLKPIKNIQISKIQSPVIGKSISTSDRIENIFTGFNPNNIESILNKNKKLNLIDESTLINSIFANVACISRSNMQAKGKVAQTEWKLGIGTIAVLGELCEKETSSDDFKKSVYLNSHLFKHTISSLEKEDYYNLTKNNKKNEIDLHFIDRMGFYLGGLHLNNYGIKNYQEIISKVENQSIKSLNNSGDNHILDTMLDENYNYNFMLVTSHKKDKNYQFNYEEKNLEINSNSPMYVKLLRNLKAKILDEESSIKFIKSFDKLNIEEELKQDFAKGYFINLNENLPIKNKEKLDLNSARELVKNFEKQNKKPKNKHNLKLF